MKKTAIKNLLVLIFTFSFLAQMFFSLLSAMASDGCSEGECKFLGIVWIGSIMIGMLMSGIGLSKLFGYVDNNKWFRAVSASLSPLFAIVIQIVILLFYLELLKMMY